MKSKRPRHERNCAVGERGLDRAAGGRASARGFGRIACGVANDDSDGFAGAIYLAAGYGACETSQGHAENEVLWMRVLVAIVSLRDLPVSWRRVPTAPLH